mgnify:CR=1 FL=1
MALVLKLRAAGRTIWAVRNAMGAEDYSRATKVPLSSHTWAPQEAHLTEGRGERRREYGRATNWQPHPSLLR